MSVEIHAPVALRNAGSQSCEATDIPAVLTAVYAREPLAWLADRFHASWSVLLGVFVLAYFGVPLLLHAANGTPRPDALAQILQPSVYYPNAFAFTYDLVGTPVLLLLLVRFPSFVRRQLSRLTEDGVVVSIPPTRGLIGRLRSPGAQLFVVVLVPLLWALAGVIQDDINYPQEGLVAQYKLSLAVVSRYARAAGVIEVLLILIAVRHLVIAPRVTPQHPDGCSGLAPFGKLALAAYAVVFVNTMMVAVGVAVGGVSMVDTLDLSATVAQMIVWLLFPFAALYIFERLIQRPHRALQLLLRQKVDLAAAAWQVEQERVATTLENGGGDVDAIEKLKAWADLNEFEASTHTWPVSPRLMRNATIVVSPIVPPLLTILARYVQ